MNDKTLRFDIFEMDPTRRQLLKNGRPIALGSRAFDLLLFLARHRGEVLSSDAIVRAIWPDTHVDKTNLRVHLSAIRKCLDDEVDQPRFITNIPGRGYRFSADISSATKTVEQDASRLKFTPPPLLSTLIGRSATISDLAEDLFRHRLITIVGPAGIGKTSVALAAANAVVNDFDEGACFVDLAVASSEEEVLRTIASTLQLTSSIQDFGTAIVDRLSQSSILLILDNCEHVIDAVARFTARILPKAAGVHLLATSREALRASGEWIRRLQPLDAPKEDSSLDIDEVLKYPAAQLFYQRALAVQRGFHPKLEDVSCLLRILARLDGVPLSIELAAAQTNVLSLEDIDDQLDQALILLKHGKRTARKRHHTLRAALDWSFNLLSAEESYVFIALSVFTGPFTRDAASSIAAEEALPPARVSELLASLVAKSLISCKTTKGATDFSYLHITRNYASERLELDQNVSQVKRRHANYLLSSFQAHASDVRQWALASLKSHSLNQELNNALEWCLSGNEAILAGRLAIASSPFWFWTGLLEQFILYGEQILTRLQDLPHQQQLTTLLLFHVGSARLNANGPDARAKSFFEDAIESARFLGDIETEKRAVAGLFQFNIASGEYERSSECEDAFEELIRKSPDDAFTVERMRLVDYLYRGRFPDAVSFANSVLSLPSESSARGSSPFVFDLRIMALTCAAKSQWLLGCPTMATELTRRAIEEGIHSQHPQSLYFSIANAGFPIPFLCGNTALAGERLKLLKEVNGNFRQQRWLDFADVFTALLDGGNPPRIIKEATSGDRVVEEWLIARGVPEGHPLIDRALNQDTLWCAPDILRHDALRRWKINKSLSEVEGFFTLAIRKAQHQQALTWELRCATSFARILLESKETDRAYSLLNATLAKISDGYDTKDYIDATVLFSEIEDEIASLR